MMVPAALAPASRLGDGDAVTPCTIEATFPAREGDWGLGYVLTRSFAPSNCTGLWRTICSISVAVMPASNSFSK
jgi:hypothetical protein